jgi:hypothetical protein
MHKCIKMFSKKINNLAPIVLFTHDRPFHLRLVLESLLKNKLSQYSKLYIFYDLPIKKNKIQEYKKTLTFLKNIKGFLKIYIIKRNVNYGLKKNIVSGIDYISKKYTKFIVLEDDIVVNENFLDFMNQSLNYYKNEKKIWHINAWNYPEFKINSKKTIFFDSLMNCWGWATWSDRWKNINFDEKKIIKNFNSEKIKKLNLDNKENFWHQFLENKNKNINTWAIFWYICISDNKGICLRPKKTFTKNIGITDNSGVNSKKTLFNLPTDRLSKKNNFKLRKFKIEDDISMNEIKRIYIMRNFFLRRYLNSIYSKLSKILFR